MMKPPLGRHGGFFAFFVLRFAFLFITLNASLYFALRFFVLHFAFLCITLRVSLYYTSRFFVFRFVLLLARKEFLWQ